MEIAPMITNIRAIYEGGVLRPIDAIFLAEGEAVNVAITQFDQPESPVRHTTTEEADYARRIRESKSLQEMFTVMASAPTSNVEMIDIVNELNQSRRLTGFRQPDPDSK
jgi:predicted DNA-binding antitoxin AbrB/MazE fold protein